MKDVKYGISPLCYVGAGSPDYGILLRPFDRGGKGEDYF